MTHSTDIPEAVEDGSFMAAAQLLPLVYDELRCLARTRLAGARSGEALTPTELVHEAYLRVAGRDSPGFENRRHFFFAASRAMRDVMVENARRRVSRKHGGDVLWIELEETEPAVQAPAETLLDLERALAKLERVSPDRARVVFLSYFGGFTQPEIAEATGLSRATVERRWSCARAWLRRELSPTSAYVHEQ